MSNRKAREGENKLPQTFISLSLTILVCVMSSQSDVIGIKVLAISTIVLALIYQNYLVKKWMSTNQTAD